MSKKRKKTIIWYFLFNPGFYYKDLFLNVFNIMNIENDVNVKYSTKNNNINDIEVFLAIKNHIRAIISSIRNLRLILKSVYKGTLLFSFCCPFKNIYKQKIFVT